MSNLQKNRLLTFIVVLFAVFSLAKPLLIGTALFALIPLLSVGILVVFAVVHGTRRFGWRSFISFFIITCVISWCYESLSILTGFPFGHYHYTDALGLKLGLVPLLIMPAYFAVGYLSWHLALILLDRFDNVSDRVQVFVVPVIAAFVMVMWDMSMDPARSTLNQLWIWHDGGSYFGVPFSNFLGWYLCVYTIFLVFALYLARWPSAIPAEQAGDTLRSSWIVVVGLYGAIFLEFVSYALFSGNSVITDPTGQNWNMLDMYRSLGLVAIFTMLFVTVLAVIKVQLSKQLN